jgi:hypothetical protein
MQQHVSAETAPLRPPPNIRNGPCGWQLMPIANVRAGGARGGWDATDAPCVTTLGPNRIRGLSYRAGPGASFGNLPGAGFIPGGAPPTRGGLSRATNPYIIQSPIVFIHVIGSEQRGGPGSGAGSSDGRSGAGLAEWEAVPCQTPRETEVPSARQPSAESASTLGLQRIRNLLSVSRGANEPTTGLQAAFAINRLGPSTAVRANAWEPRMEPREAAHIHGTALGRRL